MLVLLFALLSLCLTPVSAMADEGAESEAALSYVTDTVGLLTAEETKDLELRAAQVSEARECGVYMVIVQDFAEYSSGSIARFAEQVYDSYHLGMGAGKDAVLLVLSMEERDFDLMAHGDRANAAFTDYGKERLQQEFLDDFRYDDWYSGFCDYIAECDTYLEAAAQGEPVDVKQERGILVYVVCFGIIPLAAALIVTGILRAQLTSVKQAQQADYFLQGGMHIIRREDHFLGRNVVVTKIETQKNGGTTINSHGSSHSSGKF